MHTAAPPLELYVPGRHCVHGTTTHLLSLCGTVPLGQRAVTMAMQNSSSSMTLLMVTLRVYMWYCCGIARST